MKTKQPNFSGVGYLCRFSEWHRPRNKAVLQIDSDGSGWKTEGMWLAEALGGRWSHQQRGYVMSPNRAWHWLALYQAGFEASRRLFWNDRRPYSFQQPSLSPITLKEALAFTTIESLAA